MRADTDEPAVYKLCGGVCAFSEYTVHSAGAANMPCKLLVLHFTFVCPDDDGTAYSRRIHCILCLRGSI